LSWKSFRYWEIRIFFVVSAAFPLAFMAYIWQHVGGRAAFYFFTLFGVTFMSGRFWAGEAYRRELEKLREKLGLGSSDEQPPYGDHHDDDDQRPKE
jgi:hypothetical protein